MKKKIAVFLFDGFSDWEIAFFAPEIQKSEKFDLIYFSKDGHPVTSMGGLKIKPQFSLSELNPSDVEMLVLPGGYAWESGENDALIPLTKAVFDQGKCIATICAATVFLGQIGLLDHLKHTSNDLNYLKGIAPQYCGVAYYQNSLAETDENIITAKGIAPIEFARAIFKQVKLYNEDDIEKWFQLFKNGIWSE